MSQPNQVMFFGEDDFSKFLKKIILEALADFQKDENSPYPSREEGNTTKVYTRTEVSKLLKCSPNNVTKYIQQKKLHASVFNRQYRISEKSLLKFINQK